MKITENILFVFVFILMTSHISCQKEFIQKPEITGVSTEATTFSTFENAQKAIANVYYEVLKQGLPYSGSPLNGGSFANLSGESSRGWTWHQTYHVVNNGMNAAGFKEDDFDDNYEAIRKCYTILENIDKVKDIDEEEKTKIKGEMLCLIAYRYMNMFIRYGGIPVVDRVLVNTEDLTFPRLPLQDVLDVIVDLCDQASIVLPNSWSPDWEGRMTKGTALAIKARALMYAARPLFNSDAPYLSLGENNNLICFGNKENGRWQDAIDANEDVIAWMATNDKGVINTGEDGAGNPNSNAFVDYAVATSTPGRSNKEVLLAFKSHVQNKITTYFNISLYSTLNRFDIGNSGMTTNFLENYYKADGTDQSWPDIGIAQAKSATDYISRMKAMEPRFLADNKIHGLDPYNNPGDQNWSTLFSSFGVNQNGSSGRGNAYTTKYYYMAGGRIWFEFPLFRAAEFYLNLAEAYNEIGDEKKALKNLNVIHNRAGLPSVTESDQIKLREIIQREWAIELYYEGQRYFLVKHWKHSDIGNGIIGGAKREFQFTTNGKTPYLAENLLTYYDQVVYNTYWGVEQFLTPFPQEEVNKGIIVQNPGY